MPFRALLTVWYLRFSRLAALPWVCSMKKCPFCAEDIQEEAIRCKHCGEFLNTEKAHWADYAFRFKIMTEVEKAERWKELTYAQRRYIKREFGIEPPYLRSAPEEEETPEKILITPQWGPQVLTKSVSPKAALWLSLVAVLCIIGVIWGVVREGKRPSVTTSEGNEIKTTGVLLPAAEHLATAKKLLKGNATADAMNMAISHLGTIPSSAPEYEDAQFLITVTKKRLSEKQADEDRLSRRIEEEQNKHKYEQNQQKQKRRKAAQKLIDTCQRLGLKKFEDQGLIVLMQWDEGQWANIPYDTKQQIFDGFKLMKPAGATIRITGYYSGRILAETGLFSDTLR